MAEAVHEAGLAVAAVMLGAAKGAGPVTIVPGGSFRGICFTGHAPRYPESDLDGLALPYPLLPGRLRRYYWRPDMRESVLKSRSLN